MLKNHLGGGGGELEGGVYLVFFWRFIHSQVYDDDGM